MYITGTLCSFTRNVIFKSCFLLSELDRILHQFGQRYSENAHMTSLMEFMSEFIVNLSVKTQCEIQIQVSNLTCMSVLTNTLHGSFLLLLLSLNIFCFPINSDLNFKNSLSECRSALLTCFPSSNFSFGATKIINGSISYGGLNS